MTAQLATCSQNGIRALQQSLTRLFIVLNNVQRVEIFRIETVPAQDFLCKVTLERGKAQSSSLVVPEQKLDQGVAQPANTIVEEKWAGSGHQGFSG